MSQEKEPAGTILIFIKFHYYSLFFPYTNHRTVYLGCYYENYQNGSQRKNNELLAIKQIPIQSKFEVSDSLLQEINVLRRLKSKNIVRFIDAKKNQQNMYLVMEFCSGGTLEGYIEKNYVQNKLLLFSLFNFFYYKKKENSNRRRTSKTNVSNNQWISGSTPKQCNAQRRKTSKYFTTRWNMQVSVKKKKKN